MSKRKKIILCLVTAAAVLAIGATVAYLAATTGTASNVFTSKRYLNVELREPTWDGYTWGEELSNGSQPDGETPKSTADLTLGYNQAQHYSPGQTIPKNPMVKNVEGNDAVDAYVAIKVTYSIGGTVKSYDEFKSQLLNDSGLDFSGQWALIKEDGTNGQIYLYGSGNDSSSAATVLPVADSTLSDGTKAKGITPALFTTVPIRSNVDLVETTLTDADGNALKDSDGNVIKENLPPAFKITVKAYAVQAANVKASDAASELLKLAASN